MYSVLTSLIIFTASRVLPSLRAHMASRRLMYTRTLMSRPATAHHNVSHQITSLLNADLNETDQIHITKW